MQNIRRGIDIEAFFDFLRVAKIIEPYPYQFAPRNVSEKCFSIGVNYYKYLMYSKFGGKLGAVDNFFTTFCGEMWGKVDYFVLLPRICCNFWEI